MLNKFQNDGEMYDEFGNLKKYPVITNQAYMPLVLVMLCEKSKKEDNFVLSSTHTTSLCKESATRVELQNRTLPL